MTSLFGLSIDATATKIGLARLNYRLSARIENQIVLFDQFDSSFDSYHRGLSCRATFLNERQEFAQKDRLDGIPKFGTQYGRGNGP